MQWILFAAVGITAAIIFIEDFLSRSVHGLLFVLLAALGTVVQLMQISIAEFVLNSSINLFMVFLQVCVAVVLMRMSGRRGLWRMIGPGDVLFLAACCLLFEPFSFLLFMASSLALSLLLHIFFLRNNLYRRNGGTVALAGWQSLSLIILICTAVFSGTELYADDWIIKLIVYGY